jgi:predicted RND superfamily exporter protein
VPLDYATMMIGGVSIGVGIDYSIHFIHGVLEELKQGKELNIAVKETFIEKGKAILTNSIAVMLGFAVLIFSSMMPLRNFGETMVASMFLSALATLTLLPSAILIFKSNFIKKED